jgi:hypothetical protein
MKVHTYVRGGSLKWFVVFQGVGRKYQYFIPLPNIMGRYLKLIGITVYTFILPTTAHNFLCSYCFSCMFRLLLPVILRELTSNNPRSVQSVVHSLLNNIAAFTLIVSFLCS